MRRHGTKKRTVKFTLEFEKPSNEQILAVPCDYCKVDVGAKCRRRGWSATLSDVWTPMSGFHHSRIGIALDLKVLVRGELYKLPE